MTIIPDRCWVVAAGDTDRNYADLCIKHNVIIMGPGDLGQLNDHVAISNYREIYSSRMVSNLERFRDIEPNDMVVLRLGQSEVHAVGYVLDRSGVSPDSGYKYKSYAYSNFFADVDGWSLQHFHPVNWVWAKPDGVPMRFVNALNRGDTTQKFYRTEKNKDIFDWIERDINYCEFKGETFSSLFQKNDSLSAQDISRKLYDYGLGAISITDLDEKVLDLCRLADWYTKFGIIPSESETVSHLVTPLLLTLGWTPQRIALEYNISGKGRADIALFSNGNRKDYQPTAIVEAKKLNQSCLNASDQVKRYASELKSVYRLIVTDGIRYGVFLRKSENEEFPVYPNAYMNLTRLMGKYPIYGENCGGADEVMLFLSASWDYRLNSPKISSKEVFSEEEVSLDKVVI